MKLIIFLGNPGSEYKDTRHNFGQIVGDFYAKTQGLKWSTSKKFTAQIAEFTTPGADKIEKVLLVKPLVYYNEVGQLVKSLTDYYKIKPDQILTISDDLNLAFGRIRVRNQGADGGNNGLKSIINSLDCSNFPRIRLGTHNKTRGANLTDSAFVLSRFSTEEQRTLPAIIEQALSYIDNFISDDLSSESQSLVPES